MWLKNLIYLCIVLFSEGLAIPKPEGATRRIYEKPLSNEEHYSLNDHNVEYDHEAFLGETEAKTFDDLAPEESKLRLGKIVDKIDADKDGYVSLQELKDWIQYTQKRYIIDDTNRQWNSINLEHKSKLSWEHYKKITYGYLDDVDTEISQYKEMIDRDLRRWKKADQNIDGSLNKEEFMDFVHPEESIHMQDIVVTETIEDIDKDHDGKISIEEYVGDMYNDDDDIEKEPEWVQSEKDQFVQFRDKDKSGYMEFYEVKSWIIPEDFDDSEAEAKHLIYESDLNRDNQLSKEEILNKFDLFVGSQATDFGEALVRHDEF